MEIKDKEKPVHELSQEIRYKFAISLTIFESLLPVDGLYAIKGGYC